ncbi:saccharopine dehydrogenase NADP-binding domain-containing protein [Streptomyces sp. SID3343]|uniref:saccharopine dehydrogenase NADP-binding domain-containing protein n=1 Tax=Streptomyces sp. SID3343 TaxID=2690260 RepID=UPI0013692274|nr:saccharopine dehydrogenase NADP-binding domain-containing protein [Streptomyces sp. SID3343]MYW01249.1 NAD-dependent epimerase/dehydratase family protein [Streptomyces sp. SID3343]
MTRPLIGVLGATGSVGSAAVRTLTDLGYPRLRLGGRRGHALHALASAGEPTLNAESVVVDADDPQALRAFAKGCTVVLNCAGPSYLLGDRVARAALAGGAHYVDVAGDDPVAEQLSARGLPPDDRVVVLSAGALPGLSGLLPRLLAGDFEHVSRMSAHTGGMEDCSATVAADMMLSLTTGGADGASFGEALAGWRAGRRAARVLRTDERGRAPHFSGEVALVPFLSTETERLATALALEEADWFNVYPGPQVRAVLGRLPGRLDAGADPDTLAGEMIRAARLDLAGRSPFYTMTFTLTGVAEGRVRSRTLVLHTPSSYRLTAAVGALAVDAVVAGRVPPGVHFAAEVLAPGPVAARLRDFGICTRLEIHDTDAAGASEDEEGEL